MDSLHSIPSSELILNDDQSVYHLHLKKDDVAPTIITVGDPDRVDRVSSRFDEIYLTKQNREFRTTTGRIGTKAITVISTGIGTDNIDIVINELDALFNIDLDTKTIKKEKTSIDFIRIGTTGTIQSDTPIGSHLITDYSIGFDGLMRFYRYTENAFEIGLRQILAAWLPPDFTYQCVRTTSDISKYITKDFIPAITLTMAGFYGPQARTLRLQHLYTPAFFEKLTQLEYEDLKIQNFEMETNGIYGLANLLGHTALSFSVAIANRSSGTFSTDPYKDVENLIDRVLDEAI